MLVCTVVVPCYNEEKRLDTRAFADFLARFPSVRLLFVNDGSRDGTLSTLESLRTSFPKQVYVHDKQPNAGKADAVRVGMLAAIALPGTVYTGFWDADLATPLAQIPDFLAVLEQSSDVDMVFGARVRLLGRQIHRNGVRHYCGRIFATLASSALRLPIYDTQCGAKIFRVTPELSRVLRQPFRSRWIFDVELLARFLVLYRLQQSEPVALKIYEYPLPEWTDVAGSHVKPLDFARALVELATLRAQSARAVNAHSRAGNSRP